MKKLIIAASLGVTVLLSCKEKAPLINFGNQEVTDTSYTTTAETAAPHTVLIEEFTGASCSNCPSAHELLQSLTTTYPGRLISMALHINGFGQANPLPGAKYDFRTVKASDIGSTIYPGVTAMPSAGIDRIAIGGTLLQNRTQWSSSITTQLNYVSPVNVTATSSYDAATSVATVRIKIAYTQAVAGAIKQNLSIAVVEDSLIDKQEYPDHDDDAYQFNSIFRDMITQETGEPILQGTDKAAGLVYIRTYKYTVSPNVIWEAKNCRVIAYVNRDPADGSKEIFQAAQCQLVP